MRKPTASFDRADMRARIDELRAEAAGQRPSDRLTLHDAFLMEAALAEVDRLQSELAQCFRATGADPDGNEDWRLAQAALQEVRRLRQESDAERNHLEAEVARLQQERDDLVDEFQACVDEQCPCRRRQTHADTTFGPCNDRACRCYYLGDVVMGSDVCLWPGHGVMRPIRRDDE